MRLTPRTVTTLVRHGAMLAALTCRSSVALAQHVTESARKIPVAYDVDVVVVGGSTGAVAAAAEAARNGAKVFLAAPRPYLGEDMCATYRLWLEEGEEPESELAKAVYGETREPPGPTLPYTYEADLPSAGVHKDTDPPSLLFDGKWSSASQESVQYDGDVNVTLDLGKERLLKGILIYGYQKSANYAFASVTVSLSNDRETWVEAAQIENTNADPEEFHPLDVSAPLTGSARYVRLLVRVAPGADRLLLGEIILEDGDPNAERPSVVCMPTPMHVKHALDEALIGAGVDYLFGCYATDVLTDAHGNSAGIVMANRNGRQAVLAKVIIDATDRAWVARMAGAKFEPYSPGLQMFRRVVVIDPSKANGEVSPRSGMGMGAKELDLVIGDSRKRYRAFEYALKIPMAGGSYPSFARAEQLARDKTFDPAQVEASEFLFQVPPDPVTARHRMAGAWPGAEAVSLDVFRPQGVGRMYVLGGCAGTSREAAKQFLRPLELMALGERMGRRAAQGAKTLPKPTGIRLAGTKTSAASAGDVREFLVGLRPVDQASKTIPQSSRSVPVLGEYDVVVVGGGTSGAPAGIGAARQGAKTLLLEYLHELGGVGTLGLIGNYCAGYRGGFTAEHDADEKTLGAAVHVVAKAETWRRSNREAGTELWTGVIGCGAFVHKGKVKGVVVTTPEGRGVVLAKTTVDATGNGDIAIAAGAGYVYANAESFAMQGAGLSPRRLGESYINTDHTFVEDTDMIDVWRAFVYSREKFKSSYDHVPLPQTRERRRILGEYTVTPMDLMNRRKFPDTIYQAKGGFDTHGFTVHPFFLLNAQGPGGGHIPYRCLIPKGLDGILVTGLATSAQRDAMPPMRMQPDLQNEGYAAGVAAAHAVKLDGAVRDIDLKAVQKHLVEKECLPESVLTDEDSYPLPPERIAAAVKSLAKTKWDSSYKARKHWPLAQSAPGLPVVLAQPDASLPLLKEAYAKAETEQAKLVYAHVLAMFGEADGVETLLSTVESMDWDDGWNFTGMGQFGTAQSQLDSYLVALAHTGDKRAAPTIIKKMATLPDDPQFSHCRAVSLALQALGDPAAAKPLAELLGKPGMTGHAVTTIQEAKEDATSNSNETQVRSRALRELVLARALYKCGDHEGLGEKILREYAKDLHGVYARHALGILSQSGR